MKKFWKKTEGFTLVELIVVIAILGILAGVGTVGYSGYIKKANMAADQQLIGQVKNALELYYYTNPETVSGGYVVLGQEGTAPATDDAGVGTAAMEAAFGAGWQSTAVLNVADWSTSDSAPSYADSSYNGKEGELIQTVDKLTSALGQVVKTQQSMGNVLFGDEFDKFMTDNKVDTNDGKAIGNAAVLYVAKKTQGKETDIKTAFNTGLAAGGTNAASVVNNLYASLYATGIGDAATLAAIYAYAEGYAQSTGQAAEFHANTDFSTVTDAPSALNALGKSFEKLDDSGFTTYVANQGNKDLQGYIDVMGTVHDNADVVSGNLNASDCFTDGTVEKMLKGHGAMGDVPGGAGKVAVVLVTEDNGGAFAHVDPMNWNKR